MMFLGLAVTGFITISLKGGKIMSLLHSDTEAGSGVPPSDIHRPVTFETATFALG
jgi:hypothetical protein